MRVFIFIITLLVILYKAKCSPRDRRWLPERYSDDYSMDAPDSTHQNFLSYFWPEYFSQGSSDHGGEYTGLYYRAGGGGDPHPSGQVMMDPVHMLHNVQTLSYAQGLQQQYPHMFAHGPSGRAIGTQDDKTDEVSGRALLNLNIVSSGTKINPNRNPFIVDTTAGEGHRVFFLDSFGNIASQSLAPSSSVVLPQVSRLQTTTSGNGFFIDPSTGLVVSEFGQPIFQNRQQPFVVINQQRTDSQNSFVEPIKVSKTGQKELVVLTENNNNQQELVVVDQNNQQEIVAVEDVVSNIAETGAINPNSADKEVVLTVKETVVEPEGVSAQEAEQLSRFEALQAQEQVVDLGENINQEDQIAEIILNKNEVKTDETDIVVGVETTSEAVKARAYDAPGEPSSDVNSGDNPSLSSPLDLIYPGVMNPILKRPKPTYYPTTTYYPPPPPVYSAMPYHPPEYHPPIFPGNPMPYYGPPPGLLPHYPPLPPYSDVQQRLGRSLYPVQTHPPIYNLEVSEESTRSTIPKKKQVNLSYKPQQLQTYG